MTDQELISLLKKYDINYQSWGQGNAKTFGHLLKEINLGEAKFVERKNHLYRVVSIIVMDVYYFGEDKKLKLVEAQQIYKDGRVVKRNLKNSVLEKLVPNEDPLSGAKRALAEELGILTEVKLVAKGRLLEVAPGKSYPGIMNEGTLFSFDAFLTEKEFVAEGYQEIQDDKTNYFIWKNIN